MTRTVVKFDNVKIGIRSREGKHNRPHAHAASPRWESPDAEASIALDNFEVFENSGFDAPTLNEIVKKVMARRDELLEMWRLVNG